jgi:hypothetical protein
MAAAEGWGVGVETGVGVGGKVMGVGVGSGVGKVMGGGVGRGVGTGGKVGKTIGVAVGIEAMARRILASTVACTGSMVGDAVTEGSSSSPPQAAKARQAAMPSRARESVRRRPLEARGAVYLRLAIVVKRTPPGREAISSLAPADAFRIIRAFRPRIRMQAAHSLE